MIDGVQVKQLAIHEDERGRLMEILRVDDSLFKKFGQTYMTVCKPGFAKAWHRHKVQWDNFTCVSGTMRLVMYDAREDSPTKGELQEFLISQDNPILVTIPPMVFHGFECASEEEAITINTPTEPYNPDDPDELRIPYDDPSIPFKWSSPKGW